MAATLRLILGDQLNYKHSWYQKQDDSVTYLLAEIRSEATYTKHHIQKISGFFLAMRKFSSWLQLGVVPLLKKKIRLMRVV